MLTYIALCGHPGAGKTEVAGILQKVYGFTIVDDSRCLRDAAIALYGLTEEQVNTQTGKTSYVEVCGRRFQVRQLLGDLGKDQEDRFGEQFTPETAVSSAQQLAKTTSAKRFVFPSVRKTQGITYKRHNGIIIEIDRPGTKPSQYVFDRFDSSLVDLVISNPAPVSMPPAEVGYWLRALHNEVVRVIDIALGLPKTQPLRLVA